MPTVVVQKWEESEAGWGTRPDGYSIHLTEEDRAAYCKKFAKWQQDYFKKEYGDDRVPPEYDRICGAPYLAEVDAKVYEELTANKKQGLRIWDNKYPGNGGTDGWKNVKK